MPPEFSAPYRDPVFPPVFTFSPEGLSKARLWRGGWEPPTSHGLVFFFSQDHQHSFEFPTFSFAWRPAKRHCPPIYVLGGAVGLISLRLLGCQRPSALSPPLFFVRSPPPAYSTKACPRGFCPSCSGQ